MSELPAVEVGALTKSFARRPVLLDINLELCAGRGAMIVGGNGTGKTTLLAIIAGARSPDAGIVRIFGEDARNLTSDVRRRIGVMTHRSQLYPNLTARENLEFFATIFDVKNPRARAGELLDIVGLKKSADTRVRMLSRGMEQRVSAARALVADPDLLILDEPLASLDAAGVEALSAMITRAMARGASVVMSAHSPISLGGAQFEVFTLRNSALARAGEQAAARVSPAATRAAG